jgi:hypothetical protein
MRQYSIHFISFHLTSVYSIQYHYGRLWSFWNCLGPCRGGCNNRAHRLSKPWHRSWVVHLLEEARRWRWQHAQCQQHHRPFYLLLRLLDMQQTHTHTHTHTNTHTHDSSHCVTQNNTCSSKQHSSSNSSSHKPKAWQQHSIPSQPSMRMHAPATILQQHHHAMQHHAIMMQQQQQQVIHQRMQQLQLWQQQQQHNQHQCGKKQWLLKCSRFLSLLK